MCPISTILCQSGSAGWKNENMRYVGARDALAFPLRLNRPRLALFRRAVASVFHYTRAKDILLGKLDFPCEH